MDVTFPVRKDPTRSALPSDFSPVDPMSSVFQKSEHETIARNCMVMLKRTGNTWRKLTEDEYLAERAKDGARNVEHELVYFRAVVVYTDNPASAAAFSPSWARVLAS